MVPAMDRAFKALGDASRRQLLDRLFAEDGQTLGQLDAALPKVTRFATMKHLRVLEGAGLVSTRRVGREKRHFLNPVPIRLIHDRWIRKYAEPIVAAMSALKRSLEAEAMNAPNDSPKHVYEVYIRTTPERLWQAITDPDQTEKYFYRSRVKTTWQPGDRIEYWLPDDVLAIEGTLIEVVPNRRFVQTWHAVWDDAMRAEPPHQVTWEITPMGDSCKLTVTHDHIGVEALRQVSGGLPLIVSGLKTLLETGEALAVRG
jgi:uncharacterized protein YndB with AHSA1/START domain/DNA-binding transcriptional ArsR family regulator